METREIPTTKTINTVAPQRVPGDICVFAKPKNVLTQEEIVLADTGMCCLLLPKNRKDTWPLPKRLSTAYIGLQVKVLAKINITSDILYEYEVEDHFVDLSYHQIPR